MSQKLNPDINAQIAEDIMKWYNNDDSERLIGIVDALDKKDEATAELRAENQRLRETLKPFSEEYEQGRARYLEDPELFDSQSGELHTFITIKIKHCREATATLLQGSTNSTSNLVTTQALPELEIYREVVNTLKVASVDKEKSQVMVVGYVAGDLFARLANLGTKPGQTTVQ